MVRPLVAVGRRGHETIRKPAQFHLRLCHGDAVFMAQDDGVIGKHQRCGADDAMAALQGGLRPDAIVTDVEMPGKLDGMGLAQHVADTWPAIALPVVSGREMGAAAAGRRLTFLRKPCPPDRLLQALREQIGDDALCGAS